MNNNEDCDARWEDMPGTHNQVLHKEQFDVFLVKDGSCENPVWNIFVQGTTGKRRFAGGNTDFDSRIAAKVFAEQWLQSRKHRKEMKMVFNKAREAANILREWQDVVKPAEKKKAVCRLSVRDVADWAAWEIPRDKYGERIANTIVLAWKDEAHEFLQRSYGEVVIRRAGTGYVYFQTSYGGQEMYQFCGDKPVVFEHLNQAMLDVYTKISKAVNEENERLESTMEMLAEVEEYHEHLFT